MVDGTDLQWALQATKALLCLFELLVGAHDPGCGQLLDLKLPNVDGLEVLRRIREGGRTCLTPVVILTSSDAPIDVAAGYRHGANSYVRKAVDFDQFSELVHQLGLYWLVLNEPPPSVHDH